MQVMQPSFRNETDHGYKMFEETEALFDKYLDNGKPYDEAWQVAHSLLEFVELYIDEPEMSWLTNDHVKNVRYCQILYLVQLVLGYSTVKICHLRHPRHMRRWSYLREFVR